LTFLRHQGVYLILAQAGDSLEFTVHSRTVNEPSHAQVVVLDPQGRAFWRGGVASVETKQFNVVTPTTGTYLLVAQPAPNACAVKIANRYVALAADEFANLSGQPAQLYFWVPQGAKAFTLFADAEDGGRRSLKDSSNSTGAMGLTCSYRAW